MTRDLSAMADRMAAHGVTHVGDGIDRSLLETEL